MHTDPLTENDHTAAGGRSNLPPVPPAVRRPSLPGYAVEVDHDDETFTPPRVYSMPKASAAWAALEIAETVMANRSFYTPAQIADAGHLVDLLAAVEELDFVNGHELRTPGREFVVRCSVVDQ